MLLTSFSPWLKLAFPSEYILILNHLISSFKKINLVYFFLLPILTESHINLYICIDESSWLICHSIICTSIPFYLFFLLPCCDRKKNTEKKEAMLLLVFKTLKCKRNFFLYASWCDFNLSQQNTLTQDLNNNKKVNLISHLVTSQSHISVKRVWLTVSFGLSPKLLWSIVFISFFLLLWMLEMWTNWILGSWVQFEFRLLAKITLFL